MFHVVLYYNHVLLHLSRNQPFSIEIDLVIFLLFDLHPFNNPNFRIIQNPLPLR